MNILLLTSCIQWIHFAIAMFYFINLRRGNSWKLSHHEFWWSNGFQIFPLSDLQQSHNQQMKSSSTDTHYHTTPPYTDPSLPKLHMCWKNCKWVWNMTIRSLSNPIIFELYISQLFLLGVKTTLFIFLSNK